jgi:predicted nucleic acid-binding protein
MATYIVDASVVIEYLVAGTDTLNAEAYFEQLATEDILIVPEFCLLEWTNVIWKQVRFQSMAIQTAEALLRHLKKLPLKRVPLKAILNSALEIGLRQQLAVYDSAYIALAQIRAAIAEGVTVPPITNFTP